MRTFIPSTAGVKVIVVNPAREAGLVRFASPANFRSMIAVVGEVAHHYVRPHVGCDVAFIVGVAKCLLNSNGVESLFIKQHTEGFEAYRDFAEQTQWQDIVRGSGQGFASTARPCKRTGC